MKKTKCIRAIAYRDTWGLGQDSFLSMLYERLILMRDLLAEDGSIFVHTDSVVCHQILAIMNEIFGKDNFRNQISWLRTRASHQDGNSR